MNMTPAQLPSQKTLKIRVFIGCTGAQSRTSFDTAMGCIGAMYGEKVSVEWLNTDMMKNPKFNEFYMMSPKAFVDWLIGGDIHVIVGHLHQGLDKLRWDVVILHEEYMRLRDHIGYTGGALDYVFLQDKIKYLRALETEDYLPTLRIEMPTVSDQDDILISENELEKIRK
jgi:hypothetical protein